MKTLQLSFILVAALGGSQLLNAQIPGAPPERCTAHHAQYNAPPPPPDAPPPLQLDPDMKNFRQAPAPPEVTAMNMLHPPDDFYDR